MNEDQAAKILLVRAVEECDRCAFSENDLKDALKKAGDNIGDATWFSRRSSFLADRLSPGYKLILQMAKLPSPLIPFLCFSAFILGIATNYLGPPGKIHIIFNPILILVGWNGLLYLFLLITPILGWMNLKRFFRQLKNVVETSFAPKKGVQSPRPSKTTDKQISWKLRFFLPSIWTTFHRLTVFTSGTTHRASEFGSVASNFWDHWSRVAGSLLMSKWKRLLHCSAISLALGAILGIYLRGIFFEYNVVWTSTFIRNEETALTLIHIILYPGILFSNLLGLNLTAGLRIESLMSESGAPAASWIHLYAITALVVIILPRFLFAMWVTKRIGKLRNDVKISSDAYFGDIVESQLKNLIKQEARISCVKFSEGVAEFVCLKLYDDKIVPELEAFRKNGGKIVDLKDRIGNVCATFESEMESYITQKGLVDFKQSLSSDIEHILGGIQKDFTMDRSSGGKWAEVSQTGSDSIVGKSVKPIGDSFTNIIGATVASSVTMVVATMSGGFGNTMGIAIIAELTALGGPVGFVMGAIIGLVVAGAGWWLGREKITGAIEQVSLPGMVVRSILWESKYKRIIEEGRNKTHGVVKKQINEKMEPLLEEVTDTILLRVKRPWDE